MNAGDVYWVELPAGAGRAQAGRRPAIVVQGSEANKILPTVLLVPLTTQQDALRFMGTVLVESDNGNDQVFTLESQTGLEWAMQMGGGRRLALQALVEGQMWSGAFEQPAEASTDHDDQGGFFGATFGLHYSW